MAQFRAFWHKGPLSPYERLCLTSFIAKGHDLTLYCYERIEVPRRVELADASTVFPEKDVFFYKHGPGAGSVAGFSNWFRYKLLHELGGWWTDTDVICLSEMVPESSLSFAYQDDATLNCALLKIPAGHPLSGTLLREALALGRNFEWGQCGPHLLTRVVAELQLGHWALPSSAFYPLPYSRARDVLVPELRDKVAQAAGRSYFIHLWNEMLRQARVAKNIPPPAGSYLWEKFVEHGVDFGGAA